MVAEMSVSAAVVESVLRLGLVMVASGLLSACDLGSMSQAPVPSECAAIGAQCQLPDGPLGVCQESPCEPGANPPCFTCTSQH
jgi:hypothetical protein